MVEQWKKAISSLFFLNWKQDGTIKYVPDKYKYLFEPKLINKKTDSTCLISIDKLEKGEQEGSWRSHYVDANGYWLWEKEKIIERGQRAVNSENGIQKLDDKLYLFLELL